MFIGLNPSTADEVEDDPTIRRCVGYAKSWGFGEVVVGNLFAFRATNPNMLLEVRDPIGPRNDGWLKRMAEDADLVIGAWGNHGKLMGRSSRVLEMIPGIYCLKVNKSGHPAHPLYLKAGTQPKRFTHNNAFEETLDRDAAKVRL